MMGEGAGRISPTRKIIMFIRERWAEEFHRPMNMTRDTWVQYPAIIKKHLKTCTEDEIERRIEELFRMHAAGLLTGKFREPTIYALNEYWDRITVRMRDRLWEEQHTR